MKLDFDAIIVTSDEPYSKMWHTQLIYTEFLSKNNKVFFINPPKKWALINIFWFKLKIQKEKNDLTVVNYCNVFPNFIELFNRVNERKNEKYLTKELQKIKAHKLLIWHFDSFRSAFLNNFYIKTLVIKRIYHIIDPFYNNPLDKILCELSDIIVITSPRLNLNYTPFNTKIINIPQCLDIELQYKLLNSESRIKLKTEGKYFVLLGTISDDINFNCILELLKISDFKLVIIGKKINIIKSIIESQLVFNHANVEYLGVLLPQEFYPILKNALAGLILYTEEKIEQPRSPLKALNYLISSIPTITNIECEIPQLLGECIYHVKNKNQLYNHITNALGNELDFNLTESENYLNSVSIERAIYNITQKL